MSRLINQYTVERADHAYELAYTTLEQMKEDIKSIPFNAETAEDIKRAQAQVFNIEKSLEAIHICLRHLVAVAQASIDPQTVKDIKQINSQYRDMLIKRGINPNLSHYEQPEIGTFKPIVKSWNI